MPDTLFGRKARGTDSPVPDLRVWGVRPGMKEPILTASHASAHPAHQAYHRRFPFTMAETVCGSKSVSAAMAAIVHFRL